MSEACVERDIVCTSWMSGLIHEIRKRDGVHIVSEAKDITASVEDNPDKVLFLESSLKPFKMFEVGLANYGTAFNFDSSCPTHVILYNEINFALIAITVVGYFVMSAYVGLR